MTGGHSVWVGVLDLDDDRPVVGVNGPLLPAHEHVRLLVRVHLAPIGYVQVPAVPEHSLTLRARIAAEATLADAVRMHRQQDDSTDQAGTSAAWAARASCPFRFPAARHDGVTVVVCTRNRSSELQACLAAMQQISYEPLEILVVDNAPASDETRRVVSYFAGIDSRFRYTCEPQPGLSIARNHALGQARYDIVAFTDDDTLTDPNWPSALVAGFTADPAVICVTGLVASSSLETSSERYFDARYQIKVPFKPQEYDIDGPATRLYPFNAGIFGKGANFAVRREAIRKLGGFDPLLGAGSPARGGEDLDMFLRVILAGGHICYMPSAVIWHRHRPDAEALSEQLFAYGHGLGAFVAKHLPDRRLQAALLTSGARHAYRLVRQMRRASRISNVGPQGSKLAIDEVRGVAAGAFGYWAVRRRRSSSSPDCQ